MKLIRQQLRKLITEALEDISFEEMENIRSIAQQGPEAANMAIDLATTLADEEYDESKLGPIIAKRMLNLLDNQFGSGGRSHKKATRILEDFAEMFPDVPMEEHVLDHLMPEHHGHEGYVRDIHNLTKNVNYIIDNIIMSNSGSELDKTGALMDLDVLDAERDKLIPAIKEFINNPVELLAAMYLVTDAGSSQWDRHNALYDHAIMTVNAILAQAQGNREPMMLLWLNRGASNMLRTGYTSEYIDKIEANPGWHFGIDPEA